MARVEIGRHVAADPASVALLLAEPASADDGALVVAPPRRTGVGFTAGVSFTEALGRLVTGEVTVEPASNAGCEVRVGFDAPDREAARAVERAGSRFLAVLAARAKSRSRAA